MPSFSYFRVLFLTSFISVLVSFYVILTSFNPVFFADEWVSLSFFMENGWSNSIVCKHNGHPLVLPNLLYRSFLVFSDGDPQLRAITVWMLALCNGCLLSLVARPVSSLRTGSSTGTMSLEGLVPVASICAVSVWLVMRSQLVWGMAFHDQIAAAGALLAALGVSREVAQKAGPAYSKVLIFAGGMIATTSFGWGASVWGATVVILLLARTERVWPAVWLLVGLIATALVFTQLPDCGGGRSNIPVSLNVFHNPLPLFSFPVLNLGSPFGALVPGVLSKKLLVSGLFGSAALLFLAYTSWLVWKRREPRGPIAGLCSIMWTLAAATFLMALGRGDKFDLYALSQTPRYLPVSVLYWATIVALIWTHLSGLSGCLRRRSRHFLKLALMAMSLLVLIVNFRAIFPSQWLHAYLLGNAIQLATTGPDFDLELARRFQPNRPQAVLLGMPFIKANRYDLYKEPLLHLLGQPMESHFQILQDKICAGKFSEITKRATFNTRQYSGWATGPDGSPARSLVMVQDGLIVGIGLRARPYRVGWLESELEALGNPISTLAKYIPEPFAYWMGWHAEWVGAAQLGDAHTVHPIGTVYVIQNGQACRLNQTL